MSTIQYVTVAQALASTASGLNVLDTAANLAGAPASLWSGGRVGTVGLSASATVSGAVLAKLAAVPHLATTGAPLTVSDAAYVLLSLSAAEIKLIAHTILTGAPTLTAAQFVQLHALPGFSLAAGDHVTVSDTLAHIAGVITTHEPGFAAISAVTVRLDGSHVGALSAADLGLVAAAGVAVTFVATGANTTLAVNAAAHDIATNAAGLNDLAGHVTLSFTLTNPGATVNAADAAALAGIAGFNPAAQPLSVADTGAAITAHAAALFGHGFAGITVGSGSFAGTQTQLLDSTLHFAAGATASLSASATVGEAAANTLASLPGFSLGAGAALTVQDTAANLLALSSPAQSAATALRLSGPQSVTVQQLAGLAALGSKFSEAGNAVTVQGSASALEALAPSALALATQVSVLDTGANIAAAAQTLGTAHTNYALSQSGGTVTGTQAAQLAALGTSFSLNAQTLSVQDNAAGVTANAAALSALGIAAAVTDTVAGLTAHEAGLLALGASLSGVTVSDPAAATAAAAAALSPLVGKLTASSTLTVQDSAADVSANLAALETISAVIGTHLVLEVAGSAASLGGYATAFGHSGAGLVITLTDHAAVGAAVAAALAPLAGDFATGTALAVSDTLGNVVANAAGLDAIAAALGTVTMTGLGAAQTAAGAAGLAPLASHLAAGEQISVADTAADLAANSAALLALSQAGRLAGVSDLSDTVPGVTANAALLNSLNANVAIIDTAAHVAAAIDALSAVHGLAHITLSDATTPTLALSVAQLTNDSAVLAAIGSSYTVTVSDTAAAIEADLASLNPVIVAEWTANKLAAIISTNGPLTVTYQELGTTNFDDSIGAVLTYYSGALNVTGVPYADVAGLANLHKAPSTYAIADTAAVITTNLPAILANTHVVGLTVNDGGTLTVAVNQIAPVSALLTQTTSLSVSDSAANIANDLAAVHSVLLNELTANPAALAAIHITGGNTLSLSTTATQALVSAHELAAFATLVQAGGAALILNVSLANLPSVAAYASDHISIVVDDTAAHIAADLLSANSVLQHDSTLIGSVALTADSTIPTPTLSAAAMNALYTYGFTNPNNVTLPVADTAANILSVAATGTGALALAVQHISTTVLDSAANISTNLHALEQATLTNLHVTLTDASPVLTVSYNTYTTNLAVLDAITNVDPISNRGPVVVSDTAAALAAQANTLLADTHVGKVVVVDSAADLEASNATLPDLQVLGPLLWITLTDSTLSAASVTSALLQSAHVTTTGAGVFDTAQAIANLVINTTGAASFLNSVGATATSVSAGGITEAQAAALDSLTDFHAPGQTLLVFDNVAGLTGPGAASVLNGSLISGVYLNAAGHAATPTAAQAVALFALRNFHNTDLAGTANTITVQDSAAGIDAVHTQLAALGSQLAGIEVSASATVSDAVLGDLQALGATAINGAQLTVLDTAANIANNATAQTTGSPSITATNWLLATSASVTEAQAVVLGNLGASLNTNPSGTHQLALIVTLAANTTASVSDANALGNLHAALALNLNGYGLAITDTAAHLTTLNNNALTYVVPNASVVVSDTSPISESTAISFLALLRNNNAATGTITASQLSFAHADSVVDSIAHLQTLSNGIAALTGVAGTGWTGNTTLANGFQFTAADTVANLINGVYTTFLSGLHATTLSSSATADATDAETLATLASQIHFNLGTATLTVTDTSANLLNPLNQAGVALATTVQLTNGQVLDAADALSLLGLHNFMLTTNNPMTIQDTAANLLNPTLDNLLATSSNAAHVTVDLTGATAVTVAQAAALEALPAFSGSVTIADSSANLLAAANASIVNGQSTTVELAGNETVSAATILALTQLANFNVNSPGGVLTLAANDTANQATLAAIANLGANFSNGGHTITLTGNVTVSVAQFEQLQNDGIVLNGHTMAVSDTVAHLANLLTNPAWSNSVALHGSYQLVATDTVAGLNTLENGGMHVGLVANLYAIGLSQNDTTTAANASLLASVAANTSHQAFNAGGYSFTVTGTNANDFTSNPTGTALATVLQVNSETGAHALLTGGLFTPAAGQTVLVSDSAANLLQNADELHTAISSSAYATQIQVQLAPGAGLVPVTNVALGELLSLPRFNANGNTLSLTGGDFTPTGSAQLKQIADLGSNFQPNLLHVALGGDVSGLTAQELTNLASDNFVPGGHAVAVTDTAAALLGLSAQAAALATQLSLSSAASVTPAQLAELADLGAKFSDNGYAITLTSDALALTPTEYAALQTDGLLANQVANGHVISAALGGITATDANSVLSLTATGVAGATVKIYDEHGNLLSSTREGQAGFTISAADPADQTGHGHAFAFTEVVNGVESAPVIVLDQGMLQAAVSSANASFANNNSDIPVAAGETLHLYTAGDPQLQGLSNPALVYDPHAHTVSLDIPNSAPVVLITLGASTDPVTAASLDVVVKPHH